MEDDDIKCPKCGGETVYKTSLKSHPYKCKSCNIRFRETTDTISTNNKIGLNTWFLFVFLSLQGKSNTSSIEFSQTIGVTQTTAWFMSARLRKILIDTSDEMFEGVVEIDEAFVSRYGKFSINGISPSKLPILGIYCRDSDKYFCVPIPNRKRETIVPVIKSKVKRGSTIITDGAPVYKTLSKDYTHYFVNHSTRQYGYYVEDLNVHTNNIESFWGRFKNIIRGAHHFISQEHIKEYLNEAIFRYNRREQTKKDFMSTFNEVLLLGIENKFNQKDLKKIERHELERTPPTVYRYSYPISMKIQYIMNENGTNMFMSTRRIATAIINREGIENRENVSNSVANGIKTLINKGWVTQHPTRKLYKYIK